MKKRIVCMLLALLLLVGMLPVGVFAEGKTEYEKNETGTAVFNSVLSGQIAYVSDDPTLGWNSSPDYNITVDAALLSQTFTIADSYVGESGYWYKLAPIGEEAMPAKLSAKPWVFQNDIPTGGNVDALIITPPANTCRCCESCTGDEDCECGCGECDYCEPVTTDPTTPTDPSQPECGCCENCANAEGCTCGCEPCKFCEKEDPEVNPSVTDPVTNTVIYAESIPSDVTPVVDTNADVSAQLVKYGIPASNVVFGWDISLKNADNTEYQPDGGAWVKIPVSASAGTLVGILHNDTYMGLTQVLSDGTVEFYTDSFSEFVGFTVDFHYNGVDFSIPGLSEILLSELFEIMEIEENAFEATSVVFSDNSLIGVQRQADGDWLLTSLEAFQTEETLVITFTGGRSIVIDVTDEVQEDGTTSSGAYRWRLFDGRGPRYSFFTTSTNWPWAREGTANLYIMTERGSQASSRSETIDHCARNPYRNVVSNHSNERWYYFTSSGTTNTDEKSDGIELTGQTGGTTVFNYYEYDLDLFDQGISGESNYSTTFGAYLSSVRQTCGARISIGTVDRTVALWVQQENGSYSKIIEETGIKFPTNSAAETDIAVEIKDSLTSKYVLETNNSSSGNISHSNNVYTIRLKLKSYTATPVAGNGVSSVSGEGSYQNSLTSGTRPTFNATLKPGYQWTGDAGWYNGSTRVSTSQSYTFTMPIGNVTYTAKAVPIPYGITYSGLEGATVTPANPDTYNVESTTFTLNNPTKDGHTFIGWTGSNGTTPQTTVSITKGSTGAKSYTANWEEISYTVTFDVQGATSGSIANETLTWDEEYELPIPEKKYTVTFNHNYKQENGQQKTETVDSVANFLGWEDKGAIVYEGITWNYTDFDAPFYGKNSPDVVASSGFGNGIFNKYALLKHYILHGKGEYESDPVNNIGRKPVSGVENVWGAYAGGTLVSNLSTTDGDTVLLVATWSEMSSVTLPTPTRTGYTFGGWYTDAACTEANKVTDTTITPESNVTFYAKWTPDTREVTYKYEGTAPSGAPAVPAKTNVMPGASTKVAGAPALPGYVFSGWTTSDATVTNGAFTMPDKAVTFTGSWTKDTYSITYDLDEGDLEEGKENPSSYQVDSSSFTLNNPIKEGYTFTGWTEVISTTNWTKGFINLDTGAYEAYNGSYPRAVYSEKIYLESGVKYTLTGTNLGGIRWRFFTTDGAYVGNTSDAVFTPSQNGYVQILLYELPAGSDPTTMKITSSQGTSVPIVTGSTGDRAYTANWSVNTYTITYNHNNVTSGDPTITTDTYTIEEALTLAEAPTREGYRFTGWELEKAVTEPDGNWKADTYSAAQEFKKGQYGDITLVAQWEEQYRYVLNFDANGGSDAPDPLTKDWCEYDEHTFTWTEVPTRAGYTFIGWAESATGENNVAGTDMNSYKIKGEGAKTVEKTLYAIWERDTGDILLTYDGTTPVVVSVTCTSAVNPSELITINTVITRNTTIKDLPTGTYEVSVSSGDANYTAYVDTGSTDLQKDDEDKFKIWVESRGLSWKTGFAHVINKRGG